MASSSSFASGQQWQVRFAERMLFPTPTNSPQPHPKDAAQRGLDTVAIQSISILSRGLVQLPVVCQILFYSVPLFMSKFWAKGNVNKTYNHRVHRYYTCCVSIH